MLIGVELLETLKAYVEKEVIHVRVVLEVALIAMACKVIIEEPNTVPSLTLFGDCCTDLCLGYSAFLRAAGKARNRSWDFVRVRQKSMGDKPTRILSPVFRRAIFLLPAKRFSS